MIRIACAVLFVSLSAAADPPSPLPAQVAKAVVAQPSPPRREKKPKVEPKRGQRVAQKQREAGAR